MDVYLLHAHDFRFLPYQVEAVRRFLPEVERIIVAQGPFRGGQPWDSKVMLSARGASLLGVDVFPISDAPPGGIFARQKVLFDQLLALPGRKLILHGDCLPVETMLADDLLLGRTAAGRAHINTYDGNLILDYTWLLSEGGRSVETVLSDVQVWPASVDDADLHTEYCLPGFWHLDKVSCGHRLDEKLAMVVERFGILPSPLTVAAR